MTQETFEFCSAAWVARAQEILTELAQAAGSAIAGQRFAICEVFVDAPEHLAQADTTASWHFVIDGGAAKAAQGQYAAADVRVELDYETALPLARKIVAKDQISPVEPAAPPPRLKVTGNPQAMPPAIAAMLAPFHNRMAEVTA